MLKHEEILILINLYEYAEGENKETIEKMIVAFANRNEYTYKMETLCKDVAKQMIDRYLFDLALTIHDRIYEQNLKRI